MNDLHLPSLHDRAMLAYITVSCWSARKLDRKATSKVTKDNSATADAGRFNKHLLASADESLRALTKLGGQARRYLEANSLPWDDAGNRLLSNEKMIEVVTELTNLERQFDDLADKFTEEYPVLRAQALANLGDLANDEDYPQPDIVRQKFAMRMSLSPLPEGFGDARTGLQPQQVQALQTHFEARMRTQFNVALESAWRRLLENVTHFADRLTPDDEGKRKIFRDSMVTNARETCALLRTLNVFDEPTLDAVRMEVENHICLFDAEQLRDNDQLAKTVHGKAVDLAARMKAILGE